MHVSGPYVRNVDRSEWNLAQIKNWAKSIKLKLFRISNIIFKIDRIRKKTDKIRKEIVPYIELKISLLGGSIQTLKSFKTMTRPVISYESNGCTITEITEEYWNAFSEESVGNFIQRSKQEKFNKDKLQTNIKLIHNGI
jgi:hypothetical protein